MVARWIDDRWSVTLFIAKLFRTFENRASSYVFSISIYVPQFSSSYFCFSIPIFLFVFYYSGGQFANFHSYSFRSVLFTYFFVVFLIHKRCWMSVCRCCNIKLFVYTIFWIVNRKDFHRFGFYFLFILSLHTFPLAKNMTSVWFVAFHSWFRNGVNETIKNENINKIFHLMKLFWRDNSTEIDNNKNRHSARELLWMNWKYLFLMWICKYYIIIIDITNVIKIVSTKCFVCLFTENWHDGLTSDSNET